MNSLLGYKGEKEVKRKLRFWSQSIERLLFLVLLDVWTYSMIGGGLWVAWNVFLGCIFCVLDVP